MTITLQPEQSVNDGSECYVTASFFDQNGNPFTPSSLQYELDDLTNGINKLPFTSIIPGPSVQVTITSAQNTMNAASKLQERRQILFKVGIPGGTFRYDDLPYSLVRKMGMP